MKDYPKKYFITSGIGRSQYQLVAFDNALLDAGIADYNLVKISSIFPINCQQAKVCDFPPKGSPLLTAYATISSNKKGERIATAVCAAIPEDPDIVGVIMEYSGFCTAQEAEKTVKIMALEAMQNRKRKVKEVISSAVDCIVKSEGYTVLVSSISIW